MSAPGWDSLSRCAATDESTPPDMATTTRSQFGVLSRILREEENILRPREAVDAILPPPVALFREEILPVARASKVKVATSLSNVVPLICSGRRWARQARRRKQRWHKCRRRPSCLPALVTDRESNHGGGIIALHDVPVPKPLRRLVAEVNCRMVVSTKMQHIMCFVEPPSTRKNGTSVGRHQSAEWSGEKVVPILAVEKGNGWEFGLISTMRLHWCFFFVKTGAISAYLFANT